MEIIDLFLLVIENPRNQKAYKDLKKYYESKNMTNVSEAFGNLLKEKFDVSDDISAGKKQLNNN